MKTTMHAECENAELPKIMKLDAQAISALLWIDDVFAGVLQVPECSVARTLILMRQLELRSDIGVQLRFESGPAVGQIVCHLRREASTDEFGSLGAGVVRAMGLIAQVVRVANVLPMRPVVVGCAAVEAWRLDDLGTISAGLVGSGRSAA
jgi:hypothetical protein